MLKEPCRPGVFRIILALSLSAAFAPATARAEKPDDLHIPQGRRVNFNHVMTDGGGYRWDIQYYGNVGQGTNNAYSSGLYSQVNGSNIRSNGSGWANAAGDEIEIGPYTRNNLRCYRRIKVYKDMALARWIDIFENPTGSDISVQVQIYTSVNYGIARTITSTGGAVFGEKDWAFITQPQGNRGTPSLLHIVSSKKAKFRPTVRIQGNQIYVQYQLKVPAGKTVALCYFESQNRSVSDLEKLMKSFRGHKLLKDLSRAMRKLLVNFPTTSGYADVELERLESGDLITMRNGDPISGKIMNASFEIDGFYGPLALPSGEVIGMAAGRNSEDSVLAVLRDGQVAFGKIKGKLIIEKIGGKLQIPFSDIRQWSYRISKDKPEDVPFTGPFLVLRTGDRLAFDPDSAKFRFFTRNGEVPLDPADLLQIRMDNPSNAMHRAVFLNGSTLSGFLRPERINVKLKLGGKRLEVSRDMISSIRFAMEDKPDDTLTRIILSNGDELFGRIGEKVMRVRTDYGEMGIRIGSIRTMTFSRTHLGRTAMQLWDGSVLRGQVRREDLTFEILPGPTLKLYTGQIVSVVRSQSLPPEELVKQAEKLIPRLGAESFKDRQEATEGLLKLGPAILPILEKFKKTDDPEVRQRIGDIIEKLRRQKSVPTGAPGPAGVFPGGRIQLNGFRR